MQKIKTLLRNKNLRLILVLSFLVLVIIILKLSTPKEEPVIPEVLPTPSPVPIISVPAGQGDPNFRQSLQPTIIHSYPLFDYIPFKTSYWSIDYLGPLKLQVELVTDDSETRQEVLDWISSKGVDPGSHQILWKRK